MPTNLSLAVFVFGAVLVLLALVGGRFKLFGAEIADTIGLWGRLGAFLLGVGVLVVLLFQLGEPWPHPPRPRDPPSPPEDPAACISHHVPDLSLSRVTTLEVGSGSVTLVPSGQSLTDPVGIQLTEDRQLLDLLGVAFFPSNQFFKVLFVLNAQCELVSTYRNDTRGGDPQIVQNWDTLAIQFGQTTYGVRLGYAGGTIQSDYVRRLSLK